MTAVPNPRNAEKGKFRVASVVQVCDKDEFSYHENIAHIPLFSHPEPKQVSVPISGLGKGHGDSR